MIDPLVERPVAATPPNLEVALPMPLNHGWVAHACRAAGLAKPRWNHVERVWKVETKLESGVEVIFIREGSSRSTVSIEAPPESGRRVVTALLTGMRWAVSKRRNAEK